MSTLSDTIQAESENPSTGCINHLQSPIDDIGDDYTIIDVEQSSLTTVRDGLHMDNILSR
jgi:hypothetical protein